MSIRTVLISGLVLVTLNGYVHADPSSTCTRAAGTQTCPDGSVINQCDDCPGTNTSGNNGSGSHHKMAIAGVVVAVALLGLLVLSLTWDPTKDSSARTLPPIDGNAPSSQPGGLTLRF
jgi:hypothetical protein